MKIASFVGQEFLTIPKESIDKVEKSFTDAIKELVNDFNGGTDIKMVVREIENGTRLHIKATFYGHNVYYYEDSKRILKFKPLSIDASLYYEKGYDEAKTGPFYTWDIGFKPENDITSYALHIDLFGIEKDYVDIHNLFIGSPYICYGTDLSDLNVREGVAKIADFLKNSKPSSF